MPKPLAFKVEDEEAEAAAALAKKKADEEAASASAAGALMRPAARESWTYSNLREASVDWIKREVSCFLITEGPGNIVNKNYYTESFIRDAVKKYEGARAYLNHQTDGERRERSEGDIRTLCGYYHGLEARQVQDPKTGVTVWGTYGTLKCDKSAAGTEALAKAEAQIEYAKMFPGSPNEYCGLSINGMGVSEGDVLINGVKWNRIGAVGQADSVDVVTRPARGGAFLSLVESAGTAPILSMEESMKVRKVMAITAELTEANKQLSAATEESKRTELTTKIASLNKELGEAAKAMKGKDDKEDEESDVDNFNGDSPDAKEAAKLIPQGAGESVEAYKTRLAQVAATFKKSGESARIVTADELRKKNPRLFEAVASRVRESIESTSEDIAELKEANKKLVESNRDLQVELTIFKDTNEAEQLLVEAKLPKAVLRASDMIGLTTEEKKRKIESVQALIEEANGGRPFNPASGARSGGGKGSLKSAVEAFKSKAAA